MKFPINIICWSCDQREDENAASDFVSKVHKLHVNAALQFFLRLPENGFSFSEFFF